MTTAMMTGIHWLWFGSSVVILFNSPVLLLVKVIPPPLPPPRGGSIPFGDDDEYGDLLLELLLKLNAFTLFV